MVSLEKPIKSKTKTKTKTPSKIKTKTKTPSTKTPSTKTQTPTPNQPINDLYKIIPQFKDKSITKTLKQEPEPEKKIEIDIKNLLTPTIFNCIKTFSVNPKLGYIILTGGEAINSYLKPSNIVPTNDFDLKLVVMPEYAEDELTLKKINGIRLRFVEQLIECIRNHKITTYATIYPKMCMLIHNKSHIIYKEPNGKMYYVNEETGEEIFEYYKPNKVFKIRIYYQKTENEPIQSFEIIDVSLEYRKKEGYHYFQPTLYDTFLQQPFNSHFPIPYIKSNQGVLIPTINWLIYDLYRMLLISIDNITIAQNQPIKQQLNLQQQQQETIKNWITKLHKQMKRIQKLTSLSFVSSTEIPKLFQKIAQNYDAYQQLSYLNMVCFRDIHNQYTVIKQNKLGCDEPTYLNNLQQFHNTQYEIATIINTLKLS